MDGFQNTELDWISSKKLSPNSAYLGIFPRVVEDLTKGWVNRINEIATLAVHV